MRIVLGIEELERLLFDHFCKLPNADHPLVSRDSVMFDIDVVDHETSRSYKISLFRGNALVISEDEPDYAIMPESECLMPTVDAEDAPLLGNEGYGRPHPHANDFYHDDDDDEPLTQSEVDAISGFGDPDAEDADLESQTPRANALRGTFKP